MIEPRILNLSPIGKKLAGPHTSSGRHLGFWAVAKNVSTFKVSHREIFKSKYI